MKTKVYSINNVQLTKASETGRIHILALGSTNTSGWKDPELIDSPQPPADGDIHLDLVATAPTGIVLDVITPTAAERTIQGHAGTQCIVIHSAGGSIKQCIDIQIGDPR